MSNRDLFVTGTDTNIGKTVLSATLCAALNRAYWKPIQTGMTEGSDSETVRRYAEIPQSQTFPEAYRFDPPVSPHLAARMAGVRISLEEIQRPNSETRLVIEGAGGAMVPLNDRDLMIDLMRKLQVPIVVAARTSLGTINHSLLTIQALRNAALPFIGIVLVGEKNDENRSAIERYGDVPVIGWLPLLPSINRAALIAAFESHFDGKAFA